MAVVDNGGSNNQTEQNDADQSKGRSVDQYQSSDQQKNMLYGNGVSNNHHHQQHQMVMNGVDHHDHEAEGFKKEMRDLAEMLSKLNPMAAEFVPPSLSTSNIRPVMMPQSPTAHFGYAAVNNFLLQNNNPLFANANPNNTYARWKKGNFGHGKRRMNSRTSMAQREDVIKRTVYVSDIDHQVTEEQLAALFISCGQVVDCRVCGDPNSVLRFAFIEFTDEEGARNALSLGGTMLGYYPVRVLPSKTAIAPVNPTFLPRSEDEREMCARTIYCTNIDKKVTQADVKLFFESLCGEVYRLRLLGDYHHSTRIAFVEFVMEVEFNSLATSPSYMINEKHWRQMLDFSSIYKRSSSSVLCALCPRLDAKPLSRRGSHWKQPLYPYGVEAESAIAALNCSGAVLGSLPIRVSPSKTPVRPRAPRSVVH